MKNYIMHLIQIAMLMKNVLCSKGLAQVALLCVCLIQIYISVQFLCEILLLFIKHVYLYNDRCKLLSFVYNN